MNESFHFLRPLWLLALPAFWLLVWWYRRARASGGAWARVCDAALLPFVVQAHGGGRTRVGGPLLAAAGTLAVVALAGPTWEREPVPVFRGESALVIALDLSASMNAEDVAPSRLARARFKIADLLALRQTGQTGLVVFAAQSFVVTPLTDDTDTLLAHLQGLDTSIMPRQGSEPAAALAQAARLLEQAGAVQGHVLLITDGAEPAALERARDALTGAGFGLSVLGIGSEEGAPIPDSRGGFARHADGSMIMSRLASDALAGLAAAGGGLYLEPTSDTSDMARLQRRLDQAVDGHAERLDALAASQWREFGPWLLLALLPLAALGFRRGLIVGLACAVLPLGTPEVRADWFRTPDQAGAEAFAAGDYERAGTRFADPAWRGSAAYRAGDYERALADFAEGEDAAAHYNRGNALARLGRYEEAISAYDSALELAPDLADAAHNRELVEKLLQSDQPPPPQQGEQADQQDGDEQDADDAEPQQSQGGGGGQSSSGGEQELSDGNAMGGDEQDGGEQAESEQQGAAPSGEEEQAAAREADEGEEPQPASAAQLAEGETESEAERAQATEQWLRQIPDDPAGLLRRKFQYQYKKRYGDAPYEGNRW